MPTVATWSMRRWLPRAHSSGPQMLRELKARPIGGEETAGVPARAGAASRATKTKATHRARARLRGCVERENGFAVFMVFVLRGGGGVRRTRPAAAVKHR